MSVDWSRDYFNENGVSKIGFQFIDDSGNSRIATTSNASIAFNVGPITNVIDPRWNVLHPQTNEWINGFDELCYRGTDGQIWYTSFHANIASQNGRNQCKIEIEHHTRGGDHNHRDNSFAVVGWDGKHWKVTVYSPIDNDTAPKFHLELQ